MYTMKKFLGKGSAKLRSWLFGALQIPTYNGALQLQPVRCCATPHYASARRNSEYDNFLR
jgi:hypothetical protein